MIYEAQSCTKRLKVAYLYLLIYSFILAQTRIQINRVPQNVGVIPLFEQRLEGSGETQQTSER